MCDMNFNQEVKKVYITPNSISMECFEDSVTITYTFAIIGIAYRPVMIALETATKFLKNYINRSTLGNLIQLPIADYNGNVMYVELCSISYGTNL